MFKKIKNWFTKLLHRQSFQHNPDYTLIGVISIILVYGLIMLSSATSAVAYANHGDSYYFFKHQLFGIAIGLVLFYFLSRIDYHIWKKYAAGFLFFSIALLLLVFIPHLGAHYGKAPRWINVLGFSLQPSEFVKISFLLYLAAWLESRKSKLHEFNAGIKPFLTALGAIAILMLMQPDLGTLSIIVITALSVYFVGGGKTKHIIYIILAGVIAMMILVRIKPYQADRFRCYADPNYSPDDICYQLNQSLIAVGSGGIWGRGLGASREKFMYLPEVSGDSIFPIIGEETGFIFSVGLILLFLLLFYRGYKISKNAPDHFGRNLAIGIVTWIVAQALINIGSMIDAMPMTGVPLPFISYGGTAMMSALSAIGVLVNISKHTKIN